MSKGLNWSMKLSSEDFLNELFLQKNLENGNIWSFPFPQVVVISVIGKLPIVDIVAIFYIVYKYLFGPSVGSPFLLYSSLHPWQMAK